MTEENRAYEQAQAQAQSIVQMVGALDVDYDELEELREAHKMARVVGWNQAGFMPDAEPSRYDDNYDACEALASELEEAAERYEEDIDPDNEECPNAGVAKVLRATALELREDSPETFAQTIDGMAYWIVKAEEKTEELRELEEAAGDYENQEEAREAIQNDPLSVQVRAGWHDPGTVDVTPEEFEILLCTGGPAVRIMGELDDALQPSRAWIEYQDWGTSWTMAFNLPIEQSTLLTYCAQFHYGE